MKGVTLILAAVGLTAPAVVPAAEGSFSKTISREEFSAAGLGKLSPEEIARLDVLVRQFKVGSPAANQLGTRPVDAVPTKSSEPRSVTVAPGTEVRYEAVESRIAGEFTGWEPKTILVLENGQRWQVAPGQSYYTPAIARPAVKVVPGALGSYWMTIEGVKLRVKVTPR